MGHRGQGGHLEDRRRGGASACAAARGARALGAGGWESRGEEEGRMTRGGVVGPAPREVPAPAAAAVPAAAAAAAPPPAARTDPERLLFRGDAAAVLVQLLYWAGHAHVYLPAFHARVLTGHPRLGHVRAQRGARRQRGRRGGVPAGTVAPLAAGGPYWGRGRGGDPRPGHQGARRLACLVLRCALTHPTTQLHVRPANASSASLVR